MESQVENVSIVIIFLVSCWWGACSGEVRCLATWQVESWEVLEQGESLQVGNHDDAATCHDVHDVCKKLVIYDYDA